MLNNFDICINTRFIFGKGAEKQIGEILKKDGVKKVLIHHDNGQYLYACGDKGYKSLGAALFKLFKAFVYTVHIS